ncbi:efflux RND transporter permease subunit [Phreatobacter sp. AB_2022a]|uniref:efflux RND transporter permease subunit n=1 Tax=Phreatobacter sp. AB_2022a TaxID=3003134 RepID=UPI002287225A|nr:efflux RND transporter permease subunit [Phreatobacter sp. AB_2022a]MCZ0733073.1 efflux RND transporter permease subunit [Phreatobacter sp. AB_2022a]
MPQFFIQRPVFAWVVALLIALGGAIAIPLMPVAQYPNVAPPQISISTTYPGASPESIYQGVTRLIEEELNGAVGLLYFESTSDASGAVEITATFKPGTDPQLASVDVQNRIRRVEPRLPQAVRQQGITTEQTSAGFLMVVSLTSRDGSMDDIALGDYMARNVLAEIRRVPGVGKAQSFSTERSMRIWLDPDKMVGLNLTADDVTAAIGAQNAQVSAGSIGALPNPINQQISATVLVRGQLTTPEQFGAIVLRANPDGSTVRLRDVARVEIGGMTYAVTSRLNGKPSGAIGVMLSPTANAMATSEAVRARMQELSTFFPPGVEFSIPYDTSPFVKASIKKVLETLGEAMLLVFLVMFLFLQNIRYTMIPALVVPVALAGTCAVLLLAGFSINVLTMFAMVLAIGILVDDAIVVVENVERIMAEEKLPPREATKKAMRQITGAIIGITLVLVAVFVPMAFFPGSVGIIYKQFSITMVVSILFSALLALSLTPALCASFLKPVPEGHHEKRGFFGWFNRVFDATSHGYSGFVNKLIRRAGRFMIIYAILLVGLGYLFVRLPTAFLPNEDQGYVIVNFLGTPDATANRTLRAIETAEKHFLAEPGVERIIAITGWSFFGNGQNAALAFVTLKDWAQRGPNDSAGAIAMRGTMALSQIRDAIVFGLSPPPIQGLGTSNGFAFRLQARAGQTQAQLAAARDQLLAAAQASPIVTGLFVEGLPDAAQVQLIIDREKANTFGVTFAAINSTLTTNLGSAYVNDFPNSGRQQRVMVQGDAGSRMQTADLLNLNVRNTNGGMVPLSAFARIEWQTGPSQIVGYNGYPAVRISGQAKPGYSSGDAIAEMQRLAAELPPGFGYEWTGQSLQEIESGSQAPMLLALSCLLVFLCLAALYESWSIPIAVMLVVPLGIVGSVLAVTMRDMPNDVYFKVGLIAIIGLSAKNAILIIEFAKDLRAEGRSLFDATIEAAHLRFRPIIMTSLAFALGVVPLAIASGASAGSQQAIGTGVLGGMITATVLAVFFVPIFFVVVSRLFGGRDETKGDAPAAPPAGGHAAPAPGENAPSPQH